MTTFSYTGSVQDYVVPANVTKVVVKAWGAQGENYGGIAGGLGGYAEGDLAVTPGETLKVYVGGQVTGWNGGGNSQFNTASGGGASDVRRGGTTLADRAIVAGGGGGASSTSGRPGAPGGGLVGGSAAGGSSGGGGGTQSAGGTGADPGGLGQGGSYSSMSGHGGGGGGGYYGGGSGYYDYGGGGGSSYIDGLTDATTTSGQRAGDGQVVIEPANQPPNAPILLAPADASTLDRNVSQRFDWDFSDPDAGDSQSAYNFRYRAVGAATWAETGWQSSTQTYHDVSGGTFADGTDYEWQAATKDAQGVEGPFSSSWFFTAGTAPTPPAITEPTNGGTFNQNQTVSWSTPDQDAYQIRVMDGAAVVSDTGTVTSSTARSASVEFPTNGVTRTIQLRISNGGLWSTWAEVTGTVSWLAPPAPTFTLAADDANGALGISISNPAPSGEEPAASYNDVFVDDGAGEFRMATNVAPNGSVTYWLPKSGRDYSAAVRVRAIAENGVYSDS